MRFGECFLDNLFRPLSARAPPLLRADTTPGSLRSVPMHGLHRQPNLPDEVNERGHQQNQGDAE
jgi:hypothetical protein